MTNDVLEGVEKLIEVAKADYLKGWNPADAKDEIKREIRQKMLDEFNDTLGYTVGQKYVKVTSRGGVHSFVVNTDKDKKFKLGDILKAAGWNTPARNFARGNVLNDDFDCVKWTGAI